VLWRTYRPPGADESQASKREHRCNCTPRGPRIRNHAEKGGPVSKQVNTRVPEELYRRLKAMAKAMGLTVSALLRVAAVEYLDNHERRDSEGRVDVSDTPEKPPL